jgi:hypothetical protein
MTSENPTFAERLNSVMWDRGIGVEALARKSGVTWRLISKYRKPDGVEPRDYFGKPTANAHKLADALGVEVEWLVPPKSSRDSDPASPAAA